MSGKKRFMVVGTVVWHGVAIVPKINSRRNSSCTWKGQTGNKVGAWHGPRSTIFPCIDIFSSRTDRCNKMPFARPRKLHSAYNLLRQPDNVIHIICVINYQSNLYYLHTRLHGTSLCVNNICDVHQVFYEVGPTLYPTRFHRRVQTSLTKLWHD